MQSAVVTRKGQVTIPAEVRRALGLKRGDRVVFIQDGDVVRLERAMSIVARTAGACQSTQPARTAEELCAATERAIAQDVAARMRG